MEGDAVLPPYGLYPETAWTTKVSQGDDISWQNDVPIWKRTHEPVKRFHKQQFIPNTYRSCVLENRSVEPS